MEGKQKVALTFALYQNDALAYANPTMVALLGYDGADEILDRVTRLRGGKGAAA